MVVFNWSWYFLPLPWSLACYLFFFSFIFYFCSPSSSPPSWMSFLFLQCIDQKMWHHLLIPMLLKRYFEKPLSIFRWHLACSYNCVTYALYSNGISISIILFSKAHSMVWCQWLSWSSQKNNIMFSLTTLDVTNWSMVESFGPKLAWPCACL